MQGVGSPWDRGVRPNEEEGTAAPPRRKPLAGFFGQGNAKFVRLSIVIIRLKKTVSRRYAKEKWEARNVRSSSWRENLKCIKSYTSRCPPDATHPIGRNTQGSEFGPICLPQYGGAYLYRNPRRQTPDGPRRGNVSATHPIQHLCAHPQRPHAHTVTLLEYKYYGT